MKHFCEMNHDELMEQYKLASADFERCKQMELHLDEQGDMTGKKTIDVGYLLAATMSRLNAFYLFDFENAGTDNWLGSPMSIL